MAKNQINPTGTDEEQIIKFRKATLAIDAEAANVKAEADRFGKWAQGKRKAGFPDEAVNFENNQSKLLSKWLGLTESLRIIKKHVE